MSCPTHPQWYHSVEDCPLCAADRAAQEEASTLMAYETLSDGTLVDFEYDHVDDRLHIHAGRSLVPAERAEVFTMTLGDFHRFSDQALHLLLEGRRRRWLARQPPRR